MMSYSFRDIVPKSNFSFCKFMYDVLREAVNAGSFVAGLRGQTVGRHIMKITMDMSSHEIEYNSMATDYGLDILYAGWNPEVDSVKQQLQLAQHAETQGKTAASTINEAEFFLRRIYSSQR